MGGGSIGKPARVVALVACVVAGIGLFLRPGVSAEPRKSDLDALAERYASEVRPLVEQYCQKCHSAERAEAVLDLAAFATLPTSGRTHGPGKMCARCSTAARCPPEGRSNLPPRNENDSRDGCAAT